MTKTYTEGDNRRRARGKGRRCRRGQPDGQKSTVIKSQAAQQPQHELTMDSKSRERMIDKQLEIERERE